MELNVLGGGAVNGLVTAISDQFLDATGARIVGQFGAVGTIKETLAAGAPCDVVILTQALLEDLAKSGDVVPTSVTAVGRVPTGVAVRVGDPSPPIGDRHAFRESLLAATGIYVPDLARSTAGAHFVRILAELGIDDGVKSRLRPYPNGATAMQKMSVAKEARPIGCTQVTEILYTKGIMLVGRLPAEFQLSTVYSAGVWSKARQPETAEKFIRSLTVPERQMLRVQCGFE